MRMNKAHIIRKNMVFDCFGTIIKHRVGYLRPLIRKWQLIDKFSDNSLLKPTYYKTSCVSFSHWTEFPCPPAFFPNRQQYIFGSEKPTFLMKRLRVHAISVAHISKINIAKYMTQTIISLSTRWNIYNNNNKRTVLSVSIAPHPIHCSIRWVECHSENQQNWFLQKQKSCATVSYLLNRFLFKVFINERTKKNPQISKAFNAIKIFIPFWFQLRFILHDRNIFVWHTRGHSSPYTLRHLNFLKLCTTQHLKFRNW